MRRLDRRCEKANQRQFVSDSLHSEEEWIYLSAVNIAKAEALIAEGRMKPAGLKAFQQRTDRKSNVYSYEQEGLLNLASDELKTFKRSKAAWAYFEKLAPSYRKSMMYWVVSAKQTGTRARRLARFIESCAAGVRLLP